MKLKAGQTRCCEERTGENSVSSGASSSDALFDPTASDFPPAYSDL